VPSPWSVVAEITPVDAPPVLENYLKFTPESLRWPLDATYIEYRGESNPRFAHLDKTDGVCALIFQFMGEVGSDLASDFKTLLE